MGQNAVIMKAASQDILRTGETQMRKRSGDFQVKKEHLVASSLPMRLRSFEKSLARHCAGTLIIDAKKHSTWMRYLDSDASIDRVTISSDAGGCLPCFDGDGHVTHMDVGDAGALLATLAEVVGRGLPLERALPAFTSNPAKLLRLAGKGRIAVGADADFVALDESGMAHDVFVAGVPHVRNGRIVRSGMFESSTA